MPITKGETPRTPIEAGDHLLTLKSVVEKEMPSYNDPNKQEIRWVWVFTSQRKDELGQPQQFSVFTGSVYGNPKATLTILLDFMCPTLSGAQKASLNTDELLYQTYKARIRHEAGAT